MNLRTYQKSDAEFLIQKPFTACFNEQRTGKTPTALETIRLRGLIDDKILIVTTSSSLYQWQREYNTWLDRPCEVCDGTPAKKRKAVENWTHGLVVSLDSFKETKTRKGLMEDILPKQPKMVILDEAHKIKNTTSANAKAMFKTNKIPYRLALTGTPAQGKSYDIFAILKFLYPETFNSLWKFLEYFYIIEDKKIWVKTKNGPKEKIIKEHEIFQPGKEEELQDYLSTIATQRKRKDVMDWLPDKFYEKVQLEPTKEQKKYLKELEEVYRTGDLVTKGTLDRFIRYRQICLDPKMLGLPSKSPKTEWIKQYIKDNPDEQILIFSKFTSYLKMLSTEIDTKWAMLIGATPAKTRAKFCEDFQAKKFQVFLINIDAGKEAITLDAAETTIFTDKYPPIGSIEQAEDRFIASTEEKAHKAHKIVELMMSGTYDEVVYELLAQRKSETDIINNFNKYIERRQENE